MITTTIVEIEPGEEDTKSGVFRAVYIRVPGVERIKALLKGEFRYREIIPAVGMQVIVTHDDYLGYPIFALEGVA